RILPYSGVFVRKRGHAPQGHNVMTKINNSEPQKRDLSPQSGVWWSQPLFLGIIGLGLLLLLTPRAGVRPPADEPEDAVSRQAPEGAKTPFGPQRTPSLDQTGSRPAPWQQLPDPIPREVRTTENQPQAPVQPLESVQGTWQLNDIVTQLNDIVTQVKSGGTLTAEGAK